MIIKQAMVKMVRRLRQRYQERWARNITTISLHYYDTKGEERETHRDRQLTINTDRKRNKHTVTKLNANRKQRMMTKNMCFDDT